MRQRSILVANPGAIAEMHMMAAALASAGLLRKYIVSLAFSTAAVPGAVAHFLPPAVRRRIEIELRRRLVAQPITADDIQLVQGYEVLNPDQLICTMDKKHKFDAELEVRVGRGFATGDENKRPDQPIGLIPIDSIFSPVTRVKYAVENTRVGQRTDYDKLILEVWTDGRLTPDDALLQASAILRHHLDVFVNFNEDVIEFDETPAGVSEENMKLKKLLNMSVNEIELSVRAANCLNNANITTVGQLAQKTEAEMLKYRNFGKKSLNEIKDKLQQLQLGLGMKFDPGLVDTPIAANGAGVNGSAQEEKK